MTDEEAWKMVEENLGLGYSLAQRYYQARKRHGVVLGSGMHEEFRSAAPEILFKAAKHFDPSRGYKFSTYAGTALWRGFTRIDRQEKRSKERQDKRDLAVPGETHLYRAEVEAVLQDVGLPEKVKAVVHARYVEGMTTQETADYLGMTRKQVLTAVSRYALPKLRKNVDPDDLRPERSVTTEAVSSRESRHVHLPHESEPEPDSAPVQTTGGSSEASGNMLGRMREDKALAARHNANRRRAVDDAKAMEDWYASVNMREKKAA